MTSELPVPDLDTFRSVCRDAFGFVTAYGFREVPPQRTGNPFQVWFRRGDEFIIIAGEGYGTMASVHLEHISGVELPTIYLVPAAARSVKRKRVRFQPDQLKQIRQDASSLQTHGADFLQGDSERFFRLAKPLPPWKEKLSNAA